MGTAFCGKGVYIKSVAAGLEARVRFAISQALRVIIELGIPDLLADGERSVDELAATTDTIARLLGGEGVVQDVARRHFTLSDVGTEYL
ncbi:MAG: hypothetical protein ABIQ51_04200 [Mesorhizobium sp.]